MSEPAYRTVQGFVYAGPFEDTVNGKKIRKFSVSMPREVGEDMKVRVTVWDSHKNVAVSVGDWIVANGRWDPYESQNKDTGEFMITYNLSANKFAVLGRGLGDESDRSQITESTPTKNRKANDKIDF